MRGAVIHAPGDVRFETLDDPKILHPTDAIIRTAVTCTVTARVTSSASNTSVSPCGGSRRAVDHPHRQVDRPRINPAIAESSHVSTRWSAVAVRDATLGPPVPPDRWFVAEPTARR